MEDKLASLENIEKSSSNIAFVDPPRAGLSEAALKILKGLKDFSYIVYLSCCPESLVRDLNELVPSGQKTTGWQIKEIIPFDFFPKTKRLEVLTILEHFNGNSKSPL